MPSRSTLPVELVGQPDPGARFENMVTVLGWLAQADLAGYSFQEGGEFFIGKGREVMEARPYGKSPIVHGRGTITAVIEMTLHAIVLPAIICCSCKGTDVLEGDVADDSAGDLVDLSGDIDVDPGWDPPEDSSLDAHLDSVIDPDVHLEADIDSDSDIPLATWARLLGGTAVDSAGCPLVTEEGNIALTGRTLSFGSDDVDTWVLVLDPYGDVLRENRYDTGRENGSYFLVELDDGTLVTGGFELFSSVMSIDESGSVLWSWRYRDMDSEVILEAVESLSGGIAGCLTFRSYSALLKFGENGEFERLVYYPDSLSYEYQDPWDMTMSADGGFFLAGRVGYDGYAGYDAFILKVHEDGDPVWQRIYRTSRWQAFNSVVGMADGGAVAVGSSWAVWDGPSDGLIIRVDADGNTLLHKQLDMAGSSAIYSVAVADDGGFAATAILVSGETAQSMLVKFDASGDVEWSRSYGGSDCPVDLVSVAAMPGGGYVVAGSVEGIGAGATDAFVMRTDSLGGISGDCLFEISPLSDLVIIDVETSVVESIPPALVEDAILEPLDVTVFATECNVEELCP